MFLQMALFCSLLSRSSNTLYICITSSLFTHLLMNGQGISMFWLLWIVLLRTKGYSLFELWLCPGVWPEVGLLDYTVILFLITVKGNSILFSIVAAPTYIPTNSVGGFNFSTLFPYTTLFRSLPSHKNEQNNAICRNMDATRNYHAKWIKSERERKIPYDITYVVLCCA